MPALSLLVCWFLSPPPARAQEALLPFDAPQIQIPADSAPFQRLLDLDGDGDLDAVGSRPRINDWGRSLISGCDVRAWANDGSGRFAQIFQDLVTSTFPARVGPTDIPPLEVGDLDGDRIDDFVVAVGNELWIYRATPGAAQPFEKSVEKWNKAIWDLQVADFDGDGRGDVALLIGEPLEYYGSRLQVRWSGATGRCLSTTQPTRFSLLFEWRPKLLLLEADGDALPDLLVLNGVEMTSVRIEGRSLRRGSTFGYGYGAKVATGDIDTDGDCDIVAFGTSQVTIFRRVGPTRWTAEPPYTGGPSEYLADIDGDGDPDGVCCSGGGGGGGGGSTGDFAWLTFSSTFNISINEGGVFAPAFQMPGLGSRSLAGARDVDGDGDVDLVAGRVVYFDREPWTVRKQPQLGALRCQSEIGDLDGDGDSDPWRSPNPIPAVESIGYRNQGDGEYAWEPLQMGALPSFQSASGPRLLGDFDGDGDRDVILTVHRGYQFGPPLHLGLWRNTGGGAFEYAGPCLLRDNSQISPLPTGTIEKYVFADLQDDGDIDFVFGRRAYLNDGDGSFTTLDLNSTGSALVDLDADGRIDCVDWSSTSPIGVHRGLAPGSAELFGPYEPLFFGPTGSPETYEVADFNQDGYLDLAAVVRLDVSGDHDSFARIWLNGLNLGRGFTFVQTVPFAEASDRSTAQIHAVDVDLDGRMDLVFGPSDSVDRGFRVYRQKRSAGPMLGLGAYESPVELVLPGIMRGTDPYGYDQEIDLLRDDVDGDGDPDIVGEYLARNVRFQGAGAGARRQYGQATPGTSDLAPVLGATGPFRVGATMELRLTGATGATAVLGRSDAPASFQSGGVLTLLDTSPAAGFTTTDLTLKSSGNGASLASLPVPIDLSMIGTTAYFQAFVADPGAAGGLSATNGLRLTFGSPERPAVRRR